MLNDLLTFIGKTFYGTGIGSKFPLLQSIYRKMYKKSSKNKFTTIKIPLGLSLTLLSNDGGPTFEMTTTGSFEPLETSLFIAAVRQGDIIFDIGGHVGYYSLLGSKIVGNNGKVFVFEPVPDNISLLKENIKQNNLSNCFIISKAVADKNKDTQMYISRTSSGDHSLKTIIDSEKISIQTISIDSFAKDKNLFPNVVKIDVEGAEQMVLDGMTSTLNNKKLQTIFLELNSKGATSIKIKKLLESHGFSLFTIDEFGKKIEPWQIDIFYKSMKKHGIVNILARR